ncbi:MAG: MFS transporter [Acidobacteria bacterium]|nr:MFS transporter [Acidobacteriota bacterium]
MAPKLLGKDGFYGWVNLVVMFLFNVALMPMMMAFTFFLPFWVKEFGWSRGLASGAQTVSTILMGLAAPLVAIFIMKRGSKQAIVIGNLLSVAGLVLLAFQNHIWQLYLGIGVFLGLGVSFGGMLAMMTVINNWFVVKRPVALSISMASMGFSGVIINPSMMALINTVGWRNTYLILAAAALVFCVMLPALLIINKPEDLGQVPDGPASAKPETVLSGKPSHTNLYKTPVDFTAREALRTATLWLLVAYGALRFFAMMGVGAHIIAFQFDIGISATTAGMIGGVFSAVMGISQLGIGFLGLRIRMHKLVVIAAIFGMAGFSILLFADSVPLMLAYSVIYGISGGIGSVAVGNLFPDYFGRTEFAKIMGYTMPFNTFISGLAAPLTGYIRDVTGSYVPAFRIFFILLVLAFFCILFAKPPLHPSLKGRAKGKELEPKPVE